MRFQPLSLDDKPLIESYFSQYANWHCDSSFVANFCAEHIYHYQWCIEDGLLCMKYLSDYSETLYTYPLGNGDVLKAIASMREDAARNNVPFLLSDIPSEQLSSLRIAFPDWAFSADRRFADYIYLASDLRELKGKRLQQKRNHINKFRSLYDNYHYETLTEDMFPDCLALETEWMGEKRVQGEGIPDNLMERELTDEQIVIRTAFSNYRQLDLTGGALYVGDKLVAFTFGSPINDRLFCTHIEKAEISFEGAYAMINWLFAQHLPEQYTYIDREWDAGLVGLRKAKLSYHPSQLSPMITGRLLTEEELQVRRLWLDCFAEDTVDDVDEFLLHHFNADNMLAIREDGTIISMLHIVPFGSVAYIFAVATSPIHRCRGFSSTLIHKAIVRCKSEGYETIALIPSDCHLRQWYSQFGFSGSYPVHFDTPDDFCFGTGTPANDIAMIIGNEKIFSGKELLLQ